MPADCYDAFEAAMARLGSWTDGRPVAAAPAATIVPQLPLPPALGGRAAAGTGLPVPVVVVDRRAATRSIVAGMVVSGLTTAATLAFAVGVSVTVLPRPLRPSFSSHPASAAPSAVSAASVPNVSADDGGDDGDGGPDGRSARSSHVTAPLPDAVVGLQP